MNRPDRQPDRQPPLQPNFQSGQRGRHARAGEPGRAPSLSPAQRRAALRRQRAFAAAIARLAVRSLYAELSLHPKPGLVSLVDNGSHDDMNAATFLRSLFALRHYFRHICLAGIQGAPFARLKQLGIEAETRMMHATGGVNTHRGAIFSLGLLCAAAGRGAAQGMPLTPAALRAVLLIRWSDELAAHCGAGAPSHGLRAAALHAVSGAREEGALGLPSVFDIGLPALQASLARGAAMQQARVDTLFALMAHVSDTNVYHRGGSAGARTVRAEAERFLALGGTAHPQWRQTALACHRLFVRQRLSPGGAADLLAASCLVHAMSTLPAP
ncbi:triphosphoribosyl-dephospho-CoA synthase MdcB [Rugamonas sp. CCM 8940]|uniref:triphosphoribosyl-dephospho-CoA synthase MdcB n=1 Tax=Rugamonas sp. CCM 8940 TaxID=2765359 RepID=UPI0018F321E5|nr:triphosphoribosyl-dephospho-CoA synthase MdcB [Rugamonas sp. CCM 8940]MBJ7312638.1 triphosphoribosyl-dephospho-CoA synthase MdcB [Rugamonas sp. CCM 8940]